MATIKVYDCNGVRELKCFDTLEFVPYPVDEPCEPTSEPEEDD